jgi:Ig domain of plant-specific actin-binding protein
MQQNLHVSDIDFGEAWETASCFDRQGEDTMHFKRVLVFACVAAVPALIAAGASLGQASAAPSNTSLPSISGSARDGSILTASHGSWNGAPTGYAYQWLRCDAQAGNCNAISGATSQQYTIATADVGARLKVQVTASNKDGSGVATSRPTDTVKATGAAPKNTAPPTISGTPQEGSTLTVGPGSWSGTPSPTFSYQWERCVGTGGGCTAISGATNTTYAAASADVAHTLLVQVTAKNSNGTSTANTAETDLIRPAKAAQGGAVINVSQVSLPNRLVIDGVKFSPSPATSRGTITARFHVSDTRGFSISGALVYVVGLPYGWVFGSPEVPTDSSGWATIQIHPTRSMPLRRGALVMFVRARKQGDNLLAGVSTRRLVQESIR